MATIKGGRLIVTENVNFFLEIDRDVDTEVILIHQCAMYEARLMETRFSVARNDTPG